VWRLSESSNDQVFIPESQQFFNLRGHLELNQSRALNALSNRGAFHKDQAREQSVVIYYGDTVTQLTPLAKRRRFMTHLLFEIITIIIKKLVLLSISFFRLCRRRTLWKNSTSGSSASSGKPSIWSATSGHETPEQPTTWWRTRTRCTLASGRLLLQGGKWVAEEGAYSSHQSAPIWESNAYSWSAAVRAGREFVSYCCACESSVGCCWSQLPNDWEVCKRRRLWSRLSYCCPNSTSLIRAETRMTLKPAEGKRGGNRNFICSCEI